jgi:hypothetical protein
MRSKLTQKLIGYSGAMMLTGGALLMQAAPVRADIKYTQVMKSADGKTVNSVTKYVKQGAERSETVSEFGQMKIKNITLRLCEKNQTLTLEPTLKVYKVDTDGAGGTATGAGGASKTAAGNATGKITVTTKVQNLGTETVAGFKTRHYMINTSMQSSGCAGNANTNSKMEIWVADIKDAVACKGNDVDYMAGVNRNRDCKVTIEQKGDNAAQAYDGLIMRMKMYDGDKVTFIQEVTMLSQAKLTDEPFTLPAGYKKVSEQEFQQAQSRAMMEAMTANANNANNNDASDEDNNDKSQDNSNARKEEETRDEAEAQDKNKAEEKEEKQEEEKPKKKTKLPKFKLPF